MHTNVECLGGSARNRRKNEMSTARTALGKMQDENATIFMVESSNDSY